MSSRREEKEARRAERIAAEEAEAKAAARRRTLGIVVGAVLGLAAVGAIVAVVATGGGGKGKSNGPGTTPTVARVPIPPPQTTDLRVAAKAAGCQLRSFVPGPNDREHVTTTVSYRQNPPVFGPHAPTWASDGSYAGRPTPPTEQLVHSLEHGRILIQYKAGLDQRRIGQLESLMAEAPKTGMPPGYYQLLLPNGTGMPYEVAATAWGHQLGCPRFNDKVFDAIRTFRSAYVLKAPERIFQPE